MFSLDQAIGIHAQSVVLRARRAEILAANLANADTPHYQARDLDFSSLLKNEMDSDTLTQTSEQHMALGEASDLGAELMYRIPAQASLDQNTVDVQTERAAFLDNAMRYQASMRFLSGRFSSLLSAFRGD